MTYHPSLVMVKLRATDGNVDTRYAAKNQTGKIRCQTLSSLWPSQLQPTAKVAEGTPHLRYFPRPRRGPKQRSDSTTEEARDPVMALHPKWCPTICLRLALRCGVVDYVVVAVRLSFVNPAVLVDGGFIEKGRNEHQNGAYESNY
jgi:hypothetical protein